MIMYLYFIDVIKSISTQLLHNNTVHVAQSIRHKVLCMGTDDTYTYK